MYTKLNAVHAMRLSKETAGARPPAAAPAPPLAPPPLGRRRNRAARLIGGWAPLPPPPVTKETTASTIILLLRIPFFPFAVFPAAMRLLLLNSLCRFNCIEKFAREKRSTILKF